MLCDRSRLSALIIDDCPTRTAWIATLLEGAGFDLCHKQVKTAQQLQQFLAEISWDIILAKHPTTTLNPRTALQIMRNSGVDIPFIVISDVAMDENVTDILKLGAHDVILKQNAAFKLPLLVQRERQAATNRREISKRQGTSQSRDDHLHPLAGHLPDAYSLTCAENNELLYISSSYQELWGKSCESLYADPMSWFDAIHPDDHDKAIAQWKRFKKTGQFDVQCRIRHQDDSLRHVHVRAFPIHSDDGKIARYAWVAEDVTERETLIERMRLLEISVEHLNEMVLITTADSLDTILYVNPAFERITGYTFDETVGRTPRMLQGPKTDREALQRIRQAVDAKRPVREELFNYTRSGDPILVDINIVPIFDAQGGCTHFAAFERDVTIERNLSEQLQVAVDALSNTVEGVIILDAKGRIIEVNRAYSTITGYKSEDVIGRIARITSAQKSKTLLEWVQSARPDEENLQREAWTQRSNGVTFPVIARTSTVHNKQGEITHYVVVFMDIAERKATEAQLQHQAHHDLLTSLPNGLLLQQRGDMCLSRIRRLGGHLALLFLDIDRFKNVNDSLGHKTGDELLKQIGARLQNVVRDTDTVARQGGDEFTILLDGLVAPKAAGTVAAKLLKAFREPFTLKGRHVYVTVSIGISCFPTDGNDMGTLMHNADLAMYSAKQHGRSNYQFYNQEMNASSDTLALQTSLHQALERREFRLHYQPFVELATGRITGMEALIRWHSPELGVVPPCDFIPAAEESGLILPIEDWVLEEALKEIRTLTQSGYGDLRVAVNLSARQFQQASLVDRVAKLLAQEEVAPSQLELEITETMVMNRVEETTRCLEALHQLGITVALDDFGTGYSSLQYLKDFRIDYLKIDKSFVGGIPHDVGDLAIIRTIIGMAKSLGIRVIAEGVETHEQLDTLREMGCEEAQGFLLSIPLEADDLHWLLENHKTLPVPASRRQVG